MPLLVLLFFVAVWLLIKGSRTVPTPETAALPAGGVQSNQSNLDNLTQAIFQQEGGGLPGATNSWNNNPGNIGGGKKTFPDVGDGWGAVSSWVTSHAAKHPEWTFYDTFNYYLRGSTTAPAVDAQGDSTKYAEYVAGYVGADPNSPVSSFLGS